MTRLLPRLTEPRRHAHLAERVQRLHGRGIAVAGAPPHLGGELFESAWTARAWDCGSPSQLREEVRTRIETLGSGGLLLSPAYDLDFAPGENVAAFVQAVCDFV